MNTLDQETHLGRLDYSNILVKICSQGSLFHSFMITVLFRCTQKLVTASTSKKKNQLFDYTFLT